MRRRDFFLDFLDLYRFYSFIRSRVIRVGIEDFKVLLVEGEPFTSKLSTAAQELIRPLGSFFF